MTITQIPIMTFVVGRDAKDKATVTSFLSTDDLHADTKIVARLTILDKYGEPTTSLGLPRDGVAQLHDLLGAALADGDSAVNRLERIAARLAAACASKPPCRYCNGTGFKSWTDEAGVSHRTPERNGGKCDVCHGHGRSTAA